MLSEVNRRTRMGAMKARIFTLLGLIVGLALLLTSAVAAQKSQPPGPSPMVPVSSPEIEGAEPVGTGAPQPVFTPTPGGADVTVITTPSLLPAVSAQETICGQSNYHIVWGSAFQLFFDVCSTNEPIWGFCNPPGTPPPSVSGGYYRVTDPVFEPFGPVVLDDGRVCSRRFVSCSSREQIASCQECPAPTYYSISGRVTDSLGKPVFDVEVSATGPLNTSTRTDTDGRYTLSDLPAGTYTVSASKLVTCPNNPPAQSVTVPPSATNVDFVLPCQTFFISGRVTDASNNPIPNVTITNSGPSAGYATTGSDGRYTIYNVPAGTYTLTPSMSGCTFSPTSRSVSVPPDATGRDFTGTCAGEQKVRFRGTITYISQTTFDYGIDVQVEEVLSGPQISGEIGVALWNDWWKLLKIQFSLDRRGHGLTRQNPRLASDRTLKSGRTGSDRS